VCAGVVLVLLGEPAGAAASPPQVSGDTTVVLKGDTTVPPGGVVDRVVVFDGRVRVEGRVRHDVVVLHGSATVTGRVGGDVDVLSGRATVASTGRVGGSVRSGDPPRVARGAVVHDGVHHLRAPWTIDVFSVLGRFLVWLVVSVSTLVLGGILVLVAPRGLDAVRVAGTRGPGPAVGWGAAVGAGVPLLAGVLALTLVALPLGVALLAFLLLLYPFGYVLGALVLGRLLVGPPRSWWLALVAGWGVMRALALHPWLGALSWVAATVFGLGAAAVAIWRANRGASREDWRSVPVKG
jgi:hypothetical protein